MTLSPVKAQRDIAGALALLANLERRLPPAIHAAQQAVVHPELVDDRERAEQTGKRKGWITDPTGEAAIGITIREERYLELLEGQLATLALTVALITRFAEQWCPILGERIRCTGGRSVEEWSNPNCNNWAATYMRNDGTEATRGDGLCDACRKRKERHERDRAA